MRITARVHAGPSNAAGKADGYPNVDISIRRFKSALVHMSARLYRRLRGPREREVVGSRSLTEIGRVTIKLVLPFRALVAFSLAYKL